MESNAQKFRSWQDQSLDQFFIDNKFAFYHSQTGVAPIAAVYSHKHQHVINRLLNTLVKRSIR